MPVGIDGGDESAVHRDTVNNGREGNQHGKRDGRYPFRKVHPTADERNTDDEEHPPEVTDEVRHIRGEGRRLCFRQCYWLWCS